MDTVVRKRYEKSVKCYAPVEIRIAWSSGRLSLVLLIIDRLHVEISDVHSAIIKCEKIREHETLRIGA